MACDKVVKPTAEADNMLSFHDDENDDDDDDETDDVDSE